MRKLWLLVLAPLLVPLIPSLAEAHTARPSFVSECGTVPGTWTYAFNGIQTFDDGGQPYTASLRPTPGNLPWGTTHVSVTWIVNWTDGASDGGTVDLKRPIIDCGATPTTVGTTVPPTTAPAPTTAPVTTVPPVPTTVGPCTTAPQPGQPGYDPCGDCSNPVTCAGYLATTTTTAAAHSVAVTPQQPPRPYSGPLPATGSGLALGLTAGGLSLLGVGVALVILVTVSVRRRARQQPTWPHVQLDNTPSKPVGYHRIRSDRPEGS